MRLKVALIFFLVGFLAVIIKLFTIQVLDREQYLITAEKQRTSSTEIPAERGRLFSSGGILVTNEESYLVFANPQLIEDPKVAAKTIASILLEDTRFFSYNPVPKGVENPREYLSARLEELLEKENRQWVALARKIPVKLMRKLEEQKILGLSFDPDPRRFYPEGRLAAPVLGFVASDADGRNKGYNGLEGYYDGDLRGKSGKSNREYSQKGVPILMGDSSLLSAQNGADLYLTIDRGVQSILERKIKEGVKRYGAKSGSFVVLEPWTGRVLAMGNYPSFDPGDFSPFIPPGGNTQENKREFRNLTIAVSYEPGSIMKPVTIASALDSEEISTSWTFMDDGPLRIGASTINTWDGKHWGKQGLTQLLQKSNNVGAAEVALATGRETLRSYFLNFGFGSQLGIDLEGEEVGLVKELGNWRKIDLATAGFGQGIAITPIQMAAAYAALANGGILMKPYVVDKIVGRNGREVNFSPQSIRRVISPKTAKVVGELLRSAVSGGESIILRKTRYRIGGKTGTAQIPVGGRYDPNKSNVTFVGFPFKDRSFVMIIRLEEPSTSTFSATTVVPLWVEAFEEIAPLFGIMPDK
ncbi:MAG: penicillin-binding protein [Patescibacteria group bacterium]|nr:MAG: penicillin-binding protein [Patescibacteria group bacterium]